MSREQIMAELQRRGVPQVAQPVTQTAQQPSRDAIIAELQKRQAALQPTQQAQPVQQPQIPVEALPLGLQDIMLQTGEAVPSETIVGEAIKAGAPISPEIAAGIFGGIKGQKIGRTIAGAPGGLVGGVIGAIGGSVLGKQTQSELGLTKPETLGRSALEAGKEEAIGRAITSATGIAGKILSPFIKPITRKGRQFLESIDLIVPAQKAEDLFIKSSTFNPNNPSPRNIIDAQENILNERLLTTFEETGGRTDALRAKKLSDAVADSRRVSDANSAFMRNRDVINDRLRRVLKPTTSAERVDKVLGDTIKNSFNAKLKSYNPRFKELESKILPLRRKVKYKTGDVLEKIRGTKAAFEEKLSQKEVESIFALFEKRLQTKIPASKILDESGNLIRPEAKLIPKEIITSKELKSLDNEIESLLPKFSDSKNVQSKIAGLYAGNIKPILRDMKIRNAAENPTDNMLKLQALEADFGKLAEEKGRLVNSKVGELIGLAEGKQIRKSIAPKRMANIIFESPDTWQQTKAILQDVNPRLIPIVGDSYKAKIIQDVFDKGEINFSRVSNILRDQSDVIRDIGGNVYLRNLQDAQQIAAALEKSRAIGTARINLNLEDKIAQNAGRFLVHPLAGRIGFFGGIIARGKKAIGLGAANDADIFKAMQGVNGQRILENMSNTFLDDPNAYNTYVQFVREIKKINDNANPVPREEFEAEMGAMIGDVLDSFSRETQQ